MITNKNIKFPYYKGNIKLTKAVGLLTLSQFIEAHKSPTNQTRETIKLIQLAGSANDLELKRKLKQKLHAFTPAIKIEVGFARKYDNIVSWTGLMQLDFDKIPDVETAQILKAELFDKYNSILCCYISPSGKGVKALLKITTPKDASQFKAIHKAVEKEFEQYGGFFDVATKNAVLPLFLSYDENILYRDWSEASTWILEDNEIEKKVQLLDKPPTSYTSSKQANSEAQYNHDKAVRIFTTAVNNINDNGHPQLRTACLILGSRVGAGYIDASEAVRLAEDKIVSNSYFDKDQKGYLDTVHWAINEGAKNPKYYK